VEAIAQGSHATNPGEGAPSGNKATLEFIPELM
jgi:hypothetical protein